MTNLPNPVNAANATSCQQICKSTTGCARFGFNWKLGHCWLASTLALEVVADESFVTGPRDCSGSPSVMACKTLPGQDFPGNSPQESSAAWPKGVVPYNLQCWDRTNTSTLSPCTEHLRVLDDAADGWPGQCSGLSQSRDLSTECTAKQCQQACERSADCSVWQLNNDKACSVTNITNCSNVSVCWLGHGLNCFGAPRGLKINATQRIMRGHVRLLKNLSGFFVSNLRNAFPALANSHGFGIDQQDAVQECNHTCLGMVRCDMWQYSTESGCWVHDPSYRDVTHLSDMPHPVTSAVMSSTAPGAASVIAGEYIQRSCKPFPEGTPEVGDPASSSKEAESMTETESTTRSSTGTSTGSATTTASTSAQQTGSTTSGAPATTAEPVQDTAPAPAATTTAAQSSHKPWKMPGSLDEAMAEAANAVKQTAGTAVEEVRDRAAGAVQHHLGSDAAADNATGGSCLNSSGGKEADCTNCRSMVLHHAIQGVDYHALKANSTLECAVAAGVREAISEESMGAIRAKEVQVSFSPGSVAVESSVRVDGGLFDEVKERLQNSPSLSDSIRERVTERLGDKLQDISVGELSVSSSGNEPVAAGPPSSSATAGPPSPSTPGKESNKSLGERSIGGEEDEHGCLTSAGFAWCGVTQKCIQHFEEECKEQGSWTTVLIIVLVVLSLLAAVGAAAYFLIFRRRRGNTYSKRGIGTLETDTDTDTDASESEGDEEEPAERRVEQPRHGAGAAGRVASRNHDDGMSLASAQAAACAMRSAGSSVVDVGSSVATIELDLVTVVPQGLLVTPLNGSEPPSNVPVLTNESFSQVGLSVATVAHTSPTSSFAGPAEPVASRQLHSPLPPRPLLVVPQ